MMIFHKWKKLQKSAFGNETVGYNILHSHGMPSSDHWYWLGVGVLLIYALVFNGVVTLALAYLHRKLITNCLIS